MKYHILTVHLVTVLLAVPSYSLATAGYLAYCPCMGRFGNQADQFLGSLAFARGLGRTLVLPPWVMYTASLGKAEMVAWDSVFNVTLLAEYHEVITMEQFMEEQAEKVWPKGKRVSFCYTARNGKVNNSCNAKDGSPFGPFWNHFNINFDQSKMFAPLNFQTDPSNLSRWKEMFPPSSFPVVAMTGAPASFPVQSGHVGLQRHVMWSDTWRERGREWVRRHLPRGRWLGIHLRNGGDWANACVHTQSSENLFSSPQCLGYRNEHGTLTTSLCMPNTDTIMEQVRRVVKSVGVVAVFVASDNDHMIKQFSEQFKDQGISFHKQEKDNFMLDLVILGQSSHFIGNCVSSFSAFVKRERDVFGLPSSFWAFPTEQEREEL
eukprot:GFUD01035440.1.p1 GENE.GFUD01035440.1~~GFUD01035440.1.p1  ORF type:complete len:377 (+),score=114.61 GFUD01035440.1:95-1225(+)